MLFDAITYVSVKHISNELYMFELLLYEYTMLDRLEVKEITHHLNMVNICRELVPIPVCVNKVMS